MSEPIVGPCGGTNQPACKPTNAAKVIDGVPYYSGEQMDAHGQLNHQKGQADAHHGFKAKLKEFVDSIGNAVGEAKFGE